MRYLIAVAVLLATLLASGCGTARVAVRSTVLSSGEVDQELTVRGQGAMGEAIRDSYRLDDLRREGWTADLSREGSGYVLRLSKRVKSGEAWLPTGVASPLGITGSDTKAELSVIEGLLDREYRVHITIPPGKVQIPAQATATVDKQTAQLGEEIARSLFSMAWTVILPGEVVETNADSIVARGATWEIGLDRMQKGVEMRVVGRERRNLVPFVAAAALVLGVLAFVVARAMRRGG